MNLLYSITGQGKLMYRDNKGSYEGSWRLGKQHGKVRHQRHLDAIVKWSSGGSNLINCQGVRLFVNGNKYVGDFFNGVIEGGGIMAFANGDSLKFPSTPYLFHSPFGVYHVLQVTSMLEIGRAVTWMATECCGSLTETPTKVYMIHISIKLSLRVILAIRGIS